MGGVGQPGIWNLDAWLSSNPWEVEDSLHVKPFPYREDWNLPNCWIDNGRLALGGIEDPECIQAGTRIVTLDAPETPLTEFAGPGGAFFSDGLRVFSSNEDGLSIWAEHGTRSARIAGFRSTRQHRGNRELAEIADRTLRRWRY